MWVAVVWVLLKTALIGAFVLAGVRGAMAGGPRRAVVLVVLLAVALRLAWLIAVRPPLIGDAAWYHGRAIDLATHFQYTLDGRPTARLAPGFPIALAILYAVAGASPVLGIGLNLLLSVATVLLIFRIADRVFDERIGVTAAFITAVWPGQIPYAGVLLSEPGGHPGSRDTGA